MTSFLTVELPAVAALEALPLDVCDDGDAFSRPQRRRRAHHARRKHVGAAEDGAAAQRADDDNGVGVVLAVPLDVAGGLDDDAVGQGGLVDNEGDRQTRLCRVLLEMNFFLRFFFIT